MREGIELTRSGDRGRVVLAGAGGLCGVGFALAGGVAVGLVPAEWSKHHAVLVWGATVVLGLLGVAFAGATARRASPPPPAGALIERVHTGGAGDVVVAAAGAHVDTSSRVDEVAGDVVIAAAGAIVNIGSAAATPAPAAEVGQLVVGELPGVPPAFVERDELELLAEVLAEGRLATVSALSGTRGAGKTQIAAAYARRAVEQRVELVAWVSAATEDSLLSGLGEVARALGVADPDGDSAVSAMRLRDALAARSRPAVLVLDNATDTDTEAIRRYLPGAGATRVIITSTDRAFASFGSEIQVGLFDRAQSLAYLEARADRGDPEGAALVAQELGDLPLALAQAATVIQSQGLAYRVYLERLRALPLEQMLPPDRGDRYPESVARAILLALTAAQEDGPADGLTEQALGSIALLSPDGVGREVLAAVLAVAPDRLASLDRILAGLVGASLLVWAKDNQAVAMHGLIARTIRDQAETAGDLPTLIAATATGLQGLLVAEQQAWQHRESSVELVGHATSLWQTAVRATERDAMTTTELQANTRLAHWAVRHLRATADLSRAANVGASVLADCERVLGPDHPDTLTSRNNLASAYQTAGDLARAIALLEATLADRERVLGPDHPHTHGSRNNLAAAYQTAGDLARAIPLHEATLADHERVLGPDHPDTLTSRNNLASAYQTAGDLARAIPLLEATLADRERVLGPDHPDTLTSRNNLASAYQTAGDLARAIPLLEATLADRERVLGPDHPDTLTSRNNLAYAYRTAGNLARAIPLYEATLADSERILGPDHPNTLGSRNNLAAAYQTAGNHARAIPLLEATLADHERVLGPDHPNTLTSRNNLAYAHGAAGNLARAIPLLEATLADRERVLGPDHPDTLTSRNNLAYAHGAAGNLARAIPFYEATLADRERVLGPDHPDTLTSRNNLAYAHGAAGNLARAIPLLEATLADRERVLGPDHPDTLTSRNNLAYACAAEKKARG